MLLLTVQNVTSDSWKQIESQAISLINAFGV
jgi:hypothetical protein